MMTHLDARHTCALIVGVLRWQDAHLTSFSDVRRKDRDLYETLRERGVGPDSIDLLLDERASLAGIRRALAGQLAACGSEDLFIFYYAGHGLRRRGRGILANHDVDTEHAEETGLTVDEIGQTLVQHFHGRAVLLLADCCYSGHLARAVDDLGQAGVPAAAITSSAASSASTEDWTFTQTVIDCLRGNDLSDRNVDGVLTLRELVDDVADAMRFRERQRAGYHNLGFPEDFVIAAAKRRPDAAPSATVVDFAPGDYVEANDGDTWQTARVIAAAGRKLIVRFFDYNHSTDREVLPSEVRPIVHQTYPVGAEVFVSWNGDEYEARILEQEDGFHWVAYDGYGEEWNEWVMANRIKARGTDNRRVEVLYDGRWYPARILSEQEGKLHVTYDGFDASWDETVDPQRVRFP